nr:MAG TPA: prolyl-tRNA synthetase [Caudoviricetes sp.]
MKRCEPFDKLWHSATCIVCSTGSMSKQNR